MQDVSFQNQDLENQNPLKTAADALEVAGSRKKILGFTAPEDPKVRLLVILGGVVILLLVISLVVSLFRKGPVAPRRVAPTPTVYITPLPTENPDISNIPDTLKSKFSAVDNDIDTGINFNPPQIDPDIGAN